MNIKDKNVLFTILWALATSGVAAINATKQAAVAMRVFRMGVIRMMISSQWLLVGKEGRFLPYLTLDVAIFVCVPGPCLLETHSMQLAFGSLTRASLRY